MELNSREKSSASQKLSHISVRENVSNDLQCLTLCEELTAPIFLTASLGHLQL